MRANQVGQQPRDARASRDPLLDVVARLQDQIKELRCENARLRKNNSRLAARVAPRQQQSDVC